MAPRRSGRRNVSPYKKGEYIEYQYKGQTVTGKLFKKASSGTAEKPVWIVSPTDRRRKNEEIPEKALGKIINAQEAMNNRGPKLKKPTRGSPTSGASNSDGSTDHQLQNNHHTNQAQAHDDNNNPALPKRKNGEDNSSKAGSRSNNSTTKKRKSDDSNANTSMSEQQRIKNFQNKSVTFSQSESRKRYKKAKKANKAVLSTRIGTRSTRGSGEAVLLPELPAKRKFKLKKVKKDENVTVVKMLTGTLYLFRGERPRAEFVRNK